MEAKREKLRDVKATVVAQKGINKTQIQVERELQRLNELEKKDE